MIKNNLLKQEEEFIKLNEEIDLKTKDLLNQVDRIKESRFSDEKSNSDRRGSHPVTQVETIDDENRLDTPNKSSEGSFALNEYFSRRKDEDAKSRRSGKLSHSAKITPSLVSAQEQDSGLALGITRHKSDAKPAKGNLENDVIPETLKGVGHDGITRFLSAKVKLLSEQLEIIQKDEKNHLNKIKELQAHKEKLEEEREKLLQQANTAKSVIVKLEKQTGDITTQLQSAQTEANHLKKELETLKREMRQSNKTHSANEIKLNRTLEENEKLKAVVQQMKQEEKELKEIHRKKMEELSNAVKTLERQKMELLNGFKKQLLIIDNLKRQKDLVEAGKLLKSAEDDFFNFLDSNPPNTPRRSESMKSIRS